MAEEIEKLVEGTENVEENIKVDSSTLRQNDNTIYPGTRLEPRNNKESPEVELTTAEQSINVKKEEEESTDDDYKLKQRDKGKHVEEYRSTPSRIPIRSPRIHCTLISSDTKKLWELTVNDPPPSSSTPSSSSSKISATNRLLSLLKPKTVRFKRYKSFFDELQGNYGYLFGHFKRRFMPRTKFNELAQHLQEIMQESLPKMVDDRIKEFTNKQVPLYVSQGLIMEREKSQADVDSLVKNYMPGHILHVHPSQATPTSTQEQQHQLYLTVRDNPQVQQDDLPIWLALKYKFERLHVVTTPCRHHDVHPRDQDDPHDDAHPEGENSAKSKPDPSKSVSQELGNEISKTVNEAKLRKVDDEMLRQQCTSGDEHQYHIDQMQNFLKSEIVWENREEIIVPPYQPKSNPVVQICQRDPKAPV
ncbi:hypothetical protein Tco_1127547, partial [Tanacetum coccineum]